jgi:hypothetical protein
MFETWQRIQLLMTKMFGASDAAVREIVASVVKDKSWNFDKLSRTPNLAKVWLTSQQCVYATRVMEGLLSIIDSHEENWLNQSQDPLPDQPSQISLLALWDSSVQNSQPAASTASVSLLLHFVVLLLCLALCVCHVQVF